MGRLALCAVSLGGAAARVGRASEAALVIVDSALLRCREPEQRAASFKPRPGITRRVNFTHACGASLSLSLG